MLGVMMFMQVSRLAVAAISQSTRPLKEFSRGMIVSMAGIMAITFSVVTSVRLKSNPVLMSFLLRVA